MIKYTYYDIFFGSEFNYEMTPFKEIVHNFSLAPNSFLFHLHSSIIHSWHLNYSDYFLNSRATLLVSLSYITQVKCSVVIIHAAFLHQITSRILTQHGSLRFYSNLWFSIGARHTVLIAGRFVLIASELFQPSEQWHIRIGRIGSCLDVLV